MNRKQKRVSRRQFIKKTMAAAVATTAIAPFSEKLFAQARDQKEFDFVVIGSGAGGGPVAANLAREGFRVALLEAGGRESYLESEVPSYHGLSTEHPALSWSFGVRHYSSEKRTREEEKYRSDLNGVLYPRGSTIGGSTAINAMITMYPDNSDWDKIAQLTKDPTWNSQEMRRHFQRVESCRYRARLPNLGKHGFDGWLPTEQAKVEFLLRDRQLKKIVLAAMEAEGFKDTLSLLKKLGNLDPNDWRRVQRRLEGFFNTPMATKSGRRHGVRQLILETEEQFPDRLQIFHNCLVQRIEFQPDTQPLRAKEVHFLVGESIYAADKRSNEGSRRSARPDSVRVAREVIVAGGAFNSPQILMLSGIGPKKVLRAHGIRELIPLEGVGQNLQDRYELGVVSRTKEDFEILRDCALDIPPSDQCLDGYRQNPSNHIYSTNGSVIGLIKKSSDQKEDPDLYVFGLPGRFTGYYPGWAKDAFQKNQFTWAILKGHTLNKAGFVTLRSSDPTDTPLINFKYFEEGSDRAGEDLKAMVQGIKIVRALNKKGATVISEELVPGPQYESDDQLRDYIQKNAWGHHACGTNKMGTDDMSVVSSKFKVHGTSNVRVVDASVFPEIPGLFIVAPIYMIAEKALEDILRTARSSPF